MKMEIYNAHPIVEEPLIEKIDTSTLIAWFRCNSCFTCKFREKVIDEDPEKDIRWCSRTHDRLNIAAMVKFLGYSKE